jgi:hypothetical protein
MIQELLGYLQKDERLVHTAQLLCGLCEVELVLPRGLAALDMPSAGLRRGMLNVIIWEKDAPKIPRKMIDHVMKKPIR